MCDVEKIGTPFGNSITIEHQRDPSLRATEFVVANRHPTSGVEIGFVFICYDNGRIEIGDPQELMPGVDISATRLPTPAKPEIRHS